MSLTVGKNCFFIFTAVSFLNLCQFRRLYTTFFFQYIVNYKKRAYKKYERSLFRFCFSIFLYVQSETPMSKKIEDEFSEFQADAPSTE